MKALRQFLYSNHQAQYKAAYKKHLKRVGKAMTMSDSFLNRVLGTVFNRFLPFCGYSITTSTAPMICAARRDIHATLFNMNPAEPLRGVQLRRGARPVACTKSPGRQDLCRITPFIQFQGFTVLIVTFNISLTSAHTQGLAAVSVGRRHC